MQEQHSGWRVAPEEFSVRGKDDIASFCLRESALGIIFQVIGRMKDGFPYVRLPYRPDIDESHQ